MFGSKRQCDGARALCKSQARERASELPASIAALTRSGCPTTRAAARGCVEELVRPEQEMPQACARGARAAMGGGARAAKENCLRAATRPSDTRREIR